MNSSHFRLSMSVAYLIVLIIAPQVLGSVISKNMIHRNFTARFPGQDQLEGEIETDDGNFNFNLRRDMTVAQLQQQADNIANGIDKDQLEDILNFLETCWDNRAQVVDGVSGDDLIQIIRNQYTLVCAVFDGDHDDIAQEVQEDFPLSPVTVEGDNGPMELPPAAQVLKWGMEVSGDCLSSVHSCAASICSRRPGLRVCNRAYYSVAGIYDTCSSCQKTCLKDATIGKDWVYATMACGRMAVPGAAADF